MLPAFTNLMPFPPGKEPDLGSACNIHGFVPLSRKEERQERHRDLREHHRPAAWVRRETDGKTGVIKAISFGQAAREVFACDVARLCGITVPDVAVFQGTQNDPFAYCFSPTDDGKVRTLHTMWRKLSSQGVHEKKAIVVDKVRDYLSAYLPFAYLIGYWDFHPENIIVSTHSENSPTERIQVYACDHEGSKPDDLCYSVAALTYAWAGIFEKEEFRHLNADLLTQKVGEITALSPSELAEPIDRMIALQEQEKEPARLISPALVQHILSTRQDFLDRKFSTYEKCVRNTTHEFRYPMTFYRKSSLRHPSEGREP